MKENISAAYVKEFIDLYRLIKEIEQKEVKGKMQSGALATTEEHYNEVLETLEHALDKELDEYGVAVFEAVIQSVHWNESIERYHRTVKMIYRQRDNMALPPPMSGILSISADQITGAVYEKSKKLLQGFYYVRSIANKVSSRKYPIAEIIADTGEDFKNVERFIYNIFKGTLIESPVKWKKSQLKTLAKYFARGLKTHIKYRREHGYI